MTNSDLLDSLRTRVLDEDENISGLLRACLMLGALTGSDDLRSWASRELRGYADGDELPSYRMQLLPLFINGLSGPWQSTGEMISRFQIPEKLRDAVPEEVQFRQPIDELEQLAASTESSLQLGLPNFPAVAAMWSHGLDAFQNITSIYYRVSPSTLQGMVGAVRTTLVELVADMVKDVPMNELPSKSKVDAAVQITVNGSQDQYTSSVGTNSGVIGQGPNSIQTQTNNGVRTEELAELIRRMRDALDNEVSDPDDRADAEQAIDDFEGAVSDPNPEPATIRRRAGILTRVTSRVGGAVLSAAAAEGVQLAVQGVAGLM